jgi:hypothetical protein
VTPNEEVRKRSNNQCEAFVWVESVERWARCGGRPVEVHHMLTRARGGAVLDAIGETYHLAALCPRCHSASDGAAAYDGRLLIDGYVTSTPQGPVYTGSDEFLSHKYSGEPG